MCTSQLSDPLPIGFTLAGRYVIEAELSASPTGRVYKAGDTTLRATVAILVLAPPLRNPRDIGRSRRSFKRVFYGNRGSAYEYGEVLGVPFAALSLNGVDRVVDALDVTFRESEPHNDEMQRERPPRD